MTAPSTTARPMPTRRKTRTRPGRIVLHVFLTVLGLMWMLPLVLSVYSSFRPFEETEARGLLSWIWQLRERGELAVAESDLDAMLDELWNLPLLPAVEMPEEWS